MIALDDLIKPNWSVTNWLEDAWLILDENEQQHIQNRLDEMFVKPIPFSLEHDKMLYLHLFGLLTQLEIFGLQGLLNSLQQLVGHALYPKMRQQIVDEIFHAIIFARLTNQFAAPYALPPTINNGIENFMTLIAHEPDLSTSFAIINLVAEGWIEEIFLAMQQHAIAPEVLDVVVADESRHFEEADLYLHMGSTIKNLVTQKIAAAADVCSETALPDDSYLSKKIRAVEEELINMLFSQKEYVMSLANLIGPSGLIELLQNIDSKHHESLTKIQSTPSANWQFFMQSMPAMIQYNFHDHKHDELIENSITRNILSSLWTDPDQPTQSGTFAINVSALQFFEKKYPPETLTCLFLQAISKGLEDYPQFKNYLSHQKIYQPAESYVGLVVHLLECADHLSFIEFENCHRMNVFELSCHIQESLKILLYCYKKVEQLKKQHPHLADIANSVFSPRGEHIHLSPLFAKPVISLSNIGHWGYDSVVSPLFPNETVKFTLCKVAKQQVWNNQTKQFSVEDLAPVCISVDHRVFDANLHVPTILQNQFNTMFAAMQDFITTHIQTSRFVKPASYVDEFIAMSEQALLQNLEFGFRNLFFTSQVYKHKRSKGVLDIVPKAGVKPCRV